MLKIKDNVDLKELEKFGFKYFENGCGTTGYSKYENGIWITIIEKDKDRFSLHQERILKFVNDDLLYDLIQAGLVEKVSDE